MLGECHFVSRIMKLSQEFLKKSVGLLSPQGGDGCIGRMH